MRQKEDSVHNDPQTLFSQEEKTLRAPEVLLHDDDLRMELLGYVNCLPDRTRMALYLYYYEELEYQDILEVLSTSPEELASDLHQGIRKIKDAITALLVPERPPKSSALIPIGILCKRLFEDETERNATPERLNRLYETVSKLIAHDTQH